MDELKLEASRALFRAQKLLEDTEHLVGPRTQKHLAGGAFVEDCRRKARLAAQGEPPPARLAPKRHQNDKECQLGAVPLGSQHIGASELLHAAKGEVERGAAASGTSPGLCRGASSERHAVLSDEQKGPRRVASYAMQRSRWCTVASPDATLAETEARSSSAAGSKATAAERGQEHAASTRASLVDGQRAHERREATTSELERTRLALPGGYFRSDQQPSAPGSSSEACSGDATAATAADARTRVASAVKKPWIPR
eukprot:TRINITY_DN12770_c0_g2_i1.p1 TRINITY_DN12770_c0_g2~~TRINITY_DN12770_c0_g2_i1.p1  ORF type:complete len:256 (+),score=41.57 TRINITY_DN12770_c0_g2_i1:481-1248(+)